jgi:hypothetical protein
VVRDGEGRESLNKPLAKSIIVIISMDLRQVNAAISWHAHVEIRHQHCQVIGGRASGKHTS